MLLLRERENMYSSSSKAVWGLGCIGVRHTAFIDDAYLVMDSGQERASDVMSRPIFDELLLLCV